MLAEARLLGRAKGPVNLSAARVGVAAGGGIVSVWRLGLGLRDGVLVLIMVPACVSCSLVGSRRESEPLIALPRTRLRLLRRVTVAGMLLARVEPVLGEDLGDVCAGAGSLDFAV